MQPQYVFTDENGDEYVSSPEASEGMTIAALFAIWFLTMVGMVITLGG